MFPANKINLCIRKCSLKLWPGDGHGALERHAYLRHTEQGVPFPEGKEASSVRRYKSPKFKINNVRTGSSFFWFLIFCWL